ncbi:MAG: AtpZ/AtpI family protein [Nocardioidaceae bacterium]
MSNDVEPPLGVRDLVGLGGLIVACVVVGLGLGWFADEQLGTTPVFILLGLAVGIVAAAVGSWFRVRPFLRP